MKVNYEGAGILSNQISKSINKVDNREKIAGCATYVSDLKMEGMLYAKTLRSDRPRARIKSIDLPQLPSDYFIVDKNDVPGENRVPILLTDQPFFAEDRVNFIGEPILLVVGPDKQKVLEIIKSIRVNYEDLAPILTIEDAEREDLEPIFEGKKYYSEYGYSRGETYEAFQKAAHIFEKEYNTGYQEQMYLEPQGVLAVYEGNKICVYGSFQCPYYVHECVMHGFGWDGDRVRVVQATTGGGFGGKEDYPSIIAGQAAFAAYKTGKPVQLVFDRAEDIEATPKRHPSVIKLRTALDENNRVTALSADIRLNGGAYSTISTIVIQRTMFSIAGVYNIPAIEVKGRAVATNTVPNSAFRGFGGPQAMFAIEMHMDFIAKQLGLDPLEFKMKNMVSTGDLTATGGTFRQHVPLKELIEAVEKMSGYSKKTEEFKQLGSRPYRGIGISLFHHGCGFVGNGERDYVNGKVKLKRRADGKVEIFTAGTDMGQGARTTLSKIVAEVLEILVEDTECDFPDTDKVPNSGPTVASRTILIVGKLVHDAALELKKRWNESGELEIIQNYKHPSHVKWEVKNNEFYGDAYLSYSWGVNAVEVEIDPLTYETQVKGIWTAFDVGRAIDSKIVQGQIEGGVIQGLGYGSLEVMECKSGKIQQRSVTDYIIPTSMDFMKVESTLVDNPYEEGAFGAKGAGELTIVGAAPALAAAVSNALGISIYKVPVTPEYLMEVMENGKKD
jgi:CO/xanthine dehydrogenase Mo-binding subunit